MGQSILYFALGDSLTEGYGAPPRLGFVDQYYALIKQQLGNRVVCVNAGKKGETTEEILTRLTQSKMLQQQLQQAGIITITAGGNDMLRAAKQFLFDRDPQILKVALKQCNQHYAELIRWVKQLQRGKSAAIVRLIGLYNPFPHVEEAEFWVKYFNKMILAFETNRIKVVHVYDAFQLRVEDLLYEDHVHPNEEGYRIMAEQTARLGFRGLKIKG